MKKQIHVIDKRKVSNEELKQILLENKNIKFVSLMGVDLGGNATDEKIPVSLLLDDVDAVSYTHLINFDDAKRIEREVRHDVMSHVQAYGLQCPKAKGIIHLGATSAYVGDNTDVIQMDEALKLIRVKLVNLINNLKQFALKNKDIPTLGFTHFQAAQLTPVEKRAILEALLRTGAKKTVLIEEPLAAAMGTGLNDAEHVGAMVVDVGGGTTDIAVLCDTGVVVSASLRIGGDSFNESIIRYIRCLLYTSF